MLFFPFEWTTIQCFAFFFFFLNDWCNIVLQANNYSKKILCGQKEGLDENISLQTLFVEDEYSIVFNKISFNKPTNIILNFRINSNSVQIFCAFYYLQIQSKIIADP